MGIRDELAQQGYFELGPALPEDVIARARRDVEAKREAAFEDDALWDVLDALWPIAREALDGDAALLPAWWAWCVAPGERGWPPHRDSPANAFDHASKLARVTLWVPLADATTRNGCMFVVPANWDYEYLNPKARGAVAHEQFIRAVPARAGSILGWSHALLHWGGACAPETSPRVSTSFEFIRADLAAPQKYEPGWRPAPSERPALLEQMRTQYAHMVES
ncbi:MAG TPA: phytanoyl-CoA dioxygenase family protein [Kofleriaceae bacterium]|nr:phytanoyl-CoA dioxygenase family protein [Kofleriaceae bacterium]